jgi:hypothetical protein
MLTDCMSAVNTYMSNPLKILKHILPMVSAVNAYLGTCLLCLMYELQFSLSLFSVQEDNDFL